MLSQIINPPEKQFSKVAYSLEARVNLVRRIRRTQIWCLLAFLIWGILMAASASSVAREIHAVLQEDLTRTIGPLRLSILFFGLTVVGLAAAVGKWGACETELKFIEALRGMDDHIESEKSSNLQDQSTNR